MFENVVLRRSDAGLPLSIGDVAEALLFYQNVHLTLDFGSLHGFVQSIGIERLMTLLSRPNVSAVYCEETLGTYTDKFGVTPAHNFVAMTFSGDQKNGELKTPLRRVEGILKRHGHSGRSAAKWAERFLSRVPVRNLTNDYYLPGGIVAAATADLHDESFVHEAIRRVIGHTVGAPSVLGEFKSEVIHSEGRFFLFTDIDLDKINSIRRGLNPPLEDITLAGIANEVLLARADTALAAHYGGEFYTSELSSQIVRLRHSELLKRAGISSEEIQQLHEIVLHNSPMIREVIDSGERSFDEFLVLLDKSGRFKDWIRSVNPDEKLVTAYFKDVTAEQWIQNIPSKLVRYVLGTIAGAISPDAGLGLSAIDSFVLDKIISGWRPNHFVDRRLKPFLGSDIKRS